MLDEDDDNDVEDEDSLASGNTSSWPEQSTTDLA